MSTSVLSKQIIFGTIYRKSQIRKRQTVINVNKQATDEASLQTLCSQLKADNIQHKLWIEQPENIATCLVTKPYPKDKVQSYFKKYKLLKM